MNFTCDGILTALVTPFTASLSVEEDVLRVLVERQLAAGIRGLVVTAGSGEYVNLTPAERRRVVEIVVNVVGRRVPVVGGILEPTTWAAVEAARQAREAGADGLLLLTPFYNHPGVEGLRAHVLAVHEAVSLPIILYNNPARTGIALSPELVWELGRLPRVIGIKECHRDLAVVAREIFGAPEGFQVLSGEDDLALLTFSLGSPGAILATSNALPEEWVRLYDAWTKGDVATALGLFRQVLPFVASIYTRNHPYPLKAALAMLGQPVGPSRPPLQPPPASQVEEIRRALGGLGRGQVVR